MEILTAAEMAATDRRTAEGFGIPMATLMENAGAAVARFCLAQYAAAQRVVVLCGKGNNGGDGFVAARRLAAAGRNVKVLLLGRAEDMKGEAAAAFRALEEETSIVVIEEVTDEARLEGVKSALLWGELIIDAVVGTGFKPPLRGPASAVALCWHGRTSRWLLSTCRAVGILTPWHNAQMAPSARMQWLRLRDPNRHTSSAT